jgi:hypothetical protein
MVSTTTIDVDRIVFTVRYEVGEAEPDVGLMRDYLIIHDISTNSEVDITDDIERTVTDLLYDEVFGWYDEY